MQPVARATLRYPRRGSPNVHLPYPKAAFEPQGRFSQLSASSGLYVEGKSTRDGCGAPVSCCRQTTFWEDHHGTCQPYAISASRRARRRSWPRDAQECASHAFRHLDVAGLGGSASTAGGPATGLEQCNDRRFGPRSLHSLLGCLARQSDMAKSSYFGLAWVLSSLL